MSSNNNANSGNIILWAVNKNRAAFYTCIFFSLFINVLAFVGPLYMLQVYDRVITSRNTTTLLFITALAVYLIVVYAILENLRSAILVRLGIKFNAEARRAVYLAALDSARRMPGSGQIQALKDLDNVREFITGVGFIAFFDAPWAIVFIGASFLLHPYFGWIVLGGAFIVLGLTALNEVLTRKALGEASKASMNAIHDAGSAFRNIEVISAMAMGNAVFNKWQINHDKILVWQAIASDIAGRLVAAGKFTRAIMQIVILGVGAYLVIRQEVTAGAMIAASIIMGRALAPIEAIVAAWKQFSQVRISYHRINKLMSEQTQMNHRIRLPDPRGDLDVESVFAGPPNSTSIILQGVSFKLAAGTALAIVGPSAAGKSTLARAMVNIWPVRRGAIRIDGSDISHWDQTQLGENIGYLPQDVELFNGTIAENISRLSIGSEEDIIAAAQMAGVHELIQRLPDGYNTVVGDGGASLSGGQRQRIGLARAIYKSPALVVLDEPNSNLDSDGETSLMEAINQLKRLKRTVIIITHKTNILGVADMILVLANGQIQTIGPRDEILPKMLNRGAAGPRRVLASDAR